MRDDPELDKYVSVNTHVKVGHGQILRLPDDHLPDTELLPHGGSLDDPGLDQGDHVVSQPVHVERRREVDHDGDRDKWHDVHQLLHDVGHCRGVDPVSPEMDLQEEGGGSEAQFEQFQLGLVLSDTKLKIFYNLLFNNDRYDRLR